jgi:uncharacterized protein YukE
MNTEINYDFALSNSVAKFLEEIASDIDSKIIAKLSDDSACIASAWQSDAGEKFLEKYKSLVDELKITEEKILCEVEEIEKISRHMFLIEEKSKEIAAGKEQQN